MPEVQCDKGAKDRYMSWVMVSVDSKAPVSVRTSLPEWRVPSGHPLRRIHALTDDALTDTVPFLETVVESSERRLKEVLLLALYSIRDERALCDQLGYNLLFRWFLGMGGTEPSPEPDVVREGWLKLLADERAREILRGIVTAARAEKLLSSYHFNVDKVRVEEWAPTGAPRRDSTWPGMDSRMLDKAGACVAGRLGWLELSATEPAVALAFYTRLFGWTNRQVQQRPHHTLFEADGRVVASMHALPPLQRSVGVLPHWTPYAIVAGVDETTLHVHTLGGEVEGPFQAIGGGRDAVLVDPSGAELGLWEPAPSSGAISSGHPGAACWFELHSADPARSQFFYGSLFDWGSKVNRGEGPYASFIHDGQPFGSLREKDLDWPMPRSSWMVYFEVTDATVSALDATQLGAQITMAPTLLGGATFVVLTDPQGAMFGLLQR